MKQLEEFEGYFDVFSKFQETTMKELQDGYKILRQQQIKGPAEKSVLASHPREKSGDDKKTRDKFSHAATTRRGGQLDNCSASYTHSQLTGGPASQVRSRNNGRAEEGRPATGVSHKLPHQATTFALWLAIC